MTDTAGTAAPLFRPAVARAAADLASLRQRIASQHAAGAPGVQTSVLASDLCDALVVDIWNAVVADAPAADADALRRHVALMAHGGYGRREMAPYSASPPRRPGRQRPDRRAA